MAEQSTTDLSTLVEQLKRAADGGATADEATVNQLHEIVSLLSANASTGAEAVSDEDPAGDPIVQEATPNRSG